MKITCDKCGAKYSIADEKVKGRVFKVRCKKCSNTVVVRGDAEVPVAADAATGPDVGRSASAPQEAAIWYMVVGRDQTGPVSESQLRAAFSRGEIDGNSYVWREGFGDWLRISSVAELSDLVVSAAPEAAVSRATTGGYSTSNAPSPALAAADDAESPFGWGAEQPKAASGLAESHQSSGGWAAAPAASDGESVQASSGGPSSGIFGAAVSASPGAMSEPAEAAHGGGLFGSIDQAASDHSGGNGMSAGADFAEADESAQPRMTAQRGENSVLFSLANLQSLAMGGGKSGPSTGPDAGAFASRSDRAGSDLIDIRSMAAATASGGSSAKDEDLPVLGGFSVPVVAPVMMPVQASERPAWVMPTLFAVGGMLIAAIVVLAILLLTKSSPAPTPADPSVAATEPAAATSSAAAGKAEPSAGSAANSAATDDSKQAAAKGSDKSSGASSAAVASSDDDSNRSRRAARRHGRSSASRTRAAAREPEPQVTVADPKPRSRKPKRSHDELDDMIDKALGSGRAPAKAQPTKAASAASSGRPQTLTHAQIVQVMARVKTGVQSCYERFGVPGQANVQMRVGRDGRVKSAAVKGVFEGTPTGTCVRNAVLNARFPEFDAPTMSFTYPFILR